MGEDTKPNRSRNTALLLIGAGLFLLLDHTVGFFPILAILLVLLGIHRIRSRRERKGYVLIGAGIVILFANHLSIVISIVLILLGLYFIRSKQFPKDESYNQKHKIIDSMRLGREPWILRNSSIWYVIGETYIDLSLAILEKKETTLILQGVIGDVDIIVPEDIGISVTSSVIMGQIAAGREKEAGVLNKLIWESSNYEWADHRVKLVVSYIVGDVDIKIL
ncbi:cell wall-active antibiotics response protein LiaF [Paenibacillus hexagrammi]|uniref:Cell wall-active antibiotics response protein LiaF n=1 Tax=Paenibacillus hexagrammi TaxID=2908839 RepID=A0ABY3SGV4_9BACL|nr:cell wall-active antibiotics response protein LiaF [Paenibacillus sp. YPD9-1]UJF32416.1 cell wall-active antibiotics response protein LiaF [Paenibacillus sp. YPD9-1]